MQGFICTTAHVVHQVGISPVPVGPRAQGPAIRIGSRCLYPVSPLTGPKFNFETWDKPPLRKLTYISSLRQHMWVTCPHLAATGPQLYTFGPSDVWRTLLSDDEWCWTSLEMFALCFLFCEREIHKITFVSFVFLVLTLEVTYMFWLPTLCYVYKDIFPACLLSFKILFVLSFIMF